MRRPGIALLVLILVIFILFILLRGSCCRLFCPKKALLPPDTTLYVKEISLNILFKDNIGSVQKEKIIENIKDSVRKFYSLYNFSYGTQFTPKFDPAVWCACDSALYNLNFTCVDGAGKSASSPPPATGIAGKGDLIDVLSVSNNMAINEPLRPVIDSTVIRDGDSSQVITRITKNAVNVKTIPVDAAKIYAIIDTGIDTTLFTTGIKALIWNAPAGATIYNFLPNQPLKDLFDSGTVKHGSAVTALAIRSMQSSASYPRLMILKALDKNEKGSTFSVSCALSYAIQNHATLVNASLGYLGNEDSVLKHYIELCANHKPYPIQLFVAAGNAPGQHAVASLCNNNFNNNLLGLGKMFYPACFSEQFTNITSVTQVHKPWSFCRYQYFSNEYISLGVLNSNTRDCCSFEVDFRSLAPFFYEGSSFATPVASGLKMSIILKNMPPAQTEIIWNGMVTSDVLNLYTKDGKYIAH